MKKIIIFFTIALFIVATIQAQVKVAPQPVVKLKTVAPPPPPPPAATNKSTVTGNPITPVYSLTSARVVIRTGNDNKEFPSKVNVTLMAKSTPQNWRNYIQINLGNEMRINSDTEFGLDLEGRAPTPLENFQVDGLKLSIGYEPNFIMDAWKIENVSLIVEFKDQNGNLHPTLGRKTIAFTNAYGFLNNEYRYMQCVTDGSFLPLTAVIKKTY